MYFLKSFSTNNRTEVSLFQASDSWSSGLRKLARKMLEAGGGGSQDTFYLCSGVINVFTGLFRHPTA